MTLFHPPTTSLFSYSADASGVTASINYDSTRGYSFARTDAGSGERVSFRGLSVPGGSSWFAQARMKFSPGTSYNRLGLGVTESSTGKTLYVGMDFQNDQPILIVMSFSSLTAFNATVQNYTLAGNHFAIDSPLDYRIRYDGTNYYMEVSLDETITWITLATCAKSTYFTSAADHVGVVNESFGSTGTLQPTINVLYYEDTDHPVITNVWATTEAKDTFAALGSVNTAGEWHTTEATDTFAAVGHPVLQGALSVTDAKDTFTAAGLGPVAGTMAITEHGDTWSTSSGWDAPGIEDVTPASTNEGGQFTVTTNGPDRIIVYIFASIGTSGNFNTVSSIDGPLTWHTLDTGSQIVSHAFGDGYSLQILWAYAHDKLTSQTFHVTHDGGALMSLGLHCAVKGVNGNFNSPWAPLIYGAAPCTGGNAGNDDGTTASFPQIVPFGTGPDSHNSVPYPSIVFTASMSDVSGPGVHFGTPFPTLREIDIVGSQREGVLNLAAGIRSNSIPWVASDSSQIGIIWAEQHTQYLVLADTLQLVEPPNRMIVQEAADTMSGHGYAGSSAGPIGQLTSTDAQDHFQALGFQPVSGTLRVTEAPDKFSAFIKVPIIGTFNITEAKDKFVAHGIGLGEDGTWTTTESVDIVNVAGYTPIAGTFNTTETTDKVRFVGAGVVSQHKRRTFYVT